MMAELNGSQASMGSSASGDWGTVARIAIAAAVLLGGVAVVSVPSSMAQDAATPAKAKAARSKAAPKPKDADGDDDAQAATSGKRDPAQAQRSLESGIKLLQAGKAEPAIQTLSTVISGGNLPPHIMARALYQRGAAYRLASKPAQAVSDLTSALWLKGGLTDSERTDAIQQRAAAYREAGIADQGSDTTPPARRTASTPSAVGASQGSAGPAVTTASLAPDGPAKAEQPSPLGNFFSNLFGGSSSSAGTSSPAPASPPAPPQPAASSWSSGTTTTPAPPHPAIKSTRAAVVVAPPPPRSSAATPAATAPEGSVDARMIMRSEAEANALAGRLSGEFASQLGGRAPAVSQTQFGSMGTFFQVRVGPYKTTAEAQDLCKRIKSTGADCVAVSQ